MYTASLPVASRNLAQLSKKLPPAYDPGDLQACHKDKVDFNLLCQVQLHVCSGQHAACILPCIALMLDE